MRTKTHYFLGIITLLTLSACGSSNNPRPTGPGEASPPLDPVIATALGSFDSSPTIEKGDRRTNVFADLETIDSNTSCEYQITETIEVKDVLSAQATFAYTRTAALSGNNPANCPSQHPNLVSSQSRNDSIANFVAFERRYIERQTNPETIRQRRSWVANVAIIGNAEETRLGIRCQRIDLELQHQNGLKIRDRIWISMESQFLSLVEHERTYLDTNQTTTVDRLTSFSVRSGRLNY